jgi:MFS family permease
MLALALLTLVAGAVLITAMRSPLKDDVAWLLYVARKWLEGQRLYEDLVEVNPPLIIWLYAIPAWLAKTLDIAPKLIAIPFFAAMILAASAWSANLLAGRASIFERKIPVFAAIATVLLALPGIEFGQREHLLVAACLPYIVLYARELDGEPEPRLTGLLAGILAGLGCALKPSYLLAIIAMEAVALIRGHHSLRAAPFACFASAGLYGLGVILFCPEFLEKAVPLALALYGGTDTPSLQILWQSSRLIFGQAVIILLCWSSTTTLARRSTFKRHLLLALTAFAVAATVVFVLQGKSWFYHRLPATSATVLALFLWIASVLPPDFTIALRNVLTGFKRAHLKRLAPAPLVLGALALFALADYERLRPWVEAAVEPTLSTEVKLERLIRKEKAKTYIAFSEWIALGFPVVNNTGVTWASRFDSMWALKGEIWRAKQDGAAPREYPIRRWVAKDFVANCPDLAVVDTREGINYVSVLIASGSDFAAAWSRYHQIAAFDGLRVLKRDGDGCTPPAQKKKHLPQLSSIPGW